MKKKYKYSKIQREISMIKVIAEIAGGHEGDPDKMKSLIELAGNSGANIIKFQFYNADELCEKSHDDYELFKSLEFTIEQWNIFFKQANSHGLDVYADVFGATSFEEATLAKVDGYKLHSSDLLNIPLLTKVAQTNKVILLGIGGRKRVEIYSSLTFLYKNFPEARVVLMVGHQLFPTPVSEHSLAELRWFKEAYKDLKVEIGCADHIDGDLEEAIYWPITTLGAGATYIEKHLTIDRASKLEDYESALNPDKFQHLVDMIRKLEDSCEEYPRWTEGRIKYRAKTVKVPMLNKNSEAGSTLNWENIDFVRPINFSEPIHTDNWVKRKLILKSKNGTQLNGSVAECKVGILVNARSASTRLPQKALKTICGIPTILLLLERVSVCNNAHEVIFCTTDRKDDDVLAQLVLDAGYKVFRGPNEDVAKRLYLASVKFNCDHIVRVTGDDLLRDTDLIDIAIDSHLSKNADYTFMPEIVYGCETEIISFRALESIVSRAAISANTEYLSWYLDDDSCFIQNAIDVPDSHQRGYRLTLDTKEDFELFEIIFDKFYTEGSPIDLVEVLKFLDENEEIAHINSQISPKLNKSELNTEIRI
jgi:N,N'-diacetyllegionaminate synthase